MKINIGIMTILLCALSFSTHSEVILTGSFDAPITREGKVSDLSEAVQTIRLDDMSLAQESVIQRIVWSGSQIPEEYGIYYPIFQISIHNDIRAPGLNTFHFGPEITPIATLIVEPEISRPGPMTSSTISDFTASGLNLELPAGKYWISIALLAPNIGDENFVWKWAQANGLGISAFLDIATESFHIGSIDLKFSLWGEYVSNGLDDSDNDGVNNELDVCAETIQDEDVDYQGCASYQLDTDDDGVADDIDECPNTIDSNTQVIEWNGCPIDSF